MRTIYKTVRIDEGKCIGDGICKNICPTGAIQIVNKKAIVDEMKCAACRRCIDNCPKEAIRIFQRENPLVLGVYPEELEKIDPVKINTLCRKAGFDPKEPICLCTMIRAKEIAAVILAGAKTPEEVSLATGIRTYCAIWCSSPVQRMLRAHGLKIPSYPDSSMYDVNVSLVDLSDEIAKKYPEYRINEDKESLNKGTIDNLTSSLW